MTSSTRYGLWLLGLVLLWPRAVAAQTADVLSDPRVESVRGSLERAMAEAEAEELPVAWLADKVAEGLAKHAPAARIDQAVQTLLTRMRSANGIEARLRLPHPSEQRRLLRALVDALAAGTSVEDLRQLMLEAARELRGRSSIRHVAITVADLEERGARPSVAVDLTRLALRQAGVEGLGALRAIARRVRPDELRAAWRRRAPGLGHGATLRATMAPMGPPHDNGFGQGRGRGR